MYELTGSALILGIAGLVRFIPVMLLFPLTGYVADRYPRLSVLKAAHAVQIATVGVYFLNGVSGAASSALILALLLPFGVSRSFINTTMRSVIPSLVERTFVSRAIAYSSTASKLATLAGPVLGGVLIGAWGSTVYLCIGLTYLAAFIALTLMRPVGAANRQPEAFGKSLLGGITFLVANRSLLGAILLDFATVVCGTVLALLPVFAKDVLDSGPETLGLLRAMPAFGSIPVAALFTRLPPPGPTGLVILGSVFVHGLTVVVFGLSSTTRSLLPRLNAVAATRDPEPSTTSRPG